MPLSPPKTSDVFSATEPYKCHRNEAVTLIRRDLGQRREQIRQQFEDRAFSGVTAGRSLATAMDETLIRLAKYAGIEDEAFKESFCLCATGNYGAGLLAPFSDVDLLFITNNDPSSTLLKQIEYILYSLWDLGLKVGHATHSIKGCILSAQHDQTICTTLLYLRPLYGDFSLASKLRSEIQNYLTGRYLTEFIEAKIREREIRHQRYGETPYLVEPNLKEGRGGLRDLQVLNWISRASLGVLIPEHDPIDREFELAPSCILLGLLSPRKSYRAQKVWNFLWTVRFHLHYVTGRGEERLTFDVQPIIGARMGYAAHGNQKGVERFMRHYFLMARIVLRLGRVLQPAIMLHVLNQQNGTPPLIEEGPEGFFLINGRLAFNNKFPSPKHKELFQILDCARRTQIELHPSAIQHLINNERYAAILRGDPEITEIFLNLLCDPAYENLAQRLPNAVERPFILPLFNETGLLGRFLPYWSRIVGRTQFDSYHIYTVDEHSIESVRILRQIEAGKMADEIPLAYSLVQNLQARQELYLAVLFHDIGKGFGGDHASAGADIAMQICTQLGLSQEDSDTVSWLLLHHLLLSHTAFTRDIDDPNIILDLADIIQSPERLRLLLLLTIADIRAVSPRAWNAWKATLLHRLYSRISDVLDGGLKAREDDNRVNEIKKPLIPLMSATLDEAEIHKFMSLGRPSYWLSFDQDTLIRHAHLISSSNGDNDITIDILPLPSRDITELTIYCPDQDGLFSKIAGALALCGATISDARIHTFSNNMVLDTFWVQDSHDEAFEENSQIERLHQTIHDVLTQNIKLEEALSHATLPETRRMGAFYIPSRVIFDNNASERFTIMEVNGRDRPALLHDITSVLHKENALISSAHIATYGLRAVDVFYICDKEGRKFTQEADQKRLRSALLTVLKDQPLQKT
ncbi:[protein-PII] uridylyltransferase [Aristophania vespae]|uniref:Bifunctional uridylyltransferase/uridylyl-removing enzyme n=1 Tax=Aristophania vespae TaxID=2697033 RepID=A0A6P1ND41_9PROT|nr:[protein-PII] uridylyltransferase [Aristophania vespae]QHI95379.1 [protein-PII] uridylyltransferase [Aristophania vespae]